LEESVLAIPANELWSLITYKEQGLIRGNRKTLKQIIQKGLFHKRGELENDPYFKQIIPYAVISNKDSFYLFKRTSGQTEKRLHNKYSLGVGGHMNPVTSEEPDEQYLLSELKRELFEEIRLLNSCSIEAVEFIGFINDDTIPVGRVHIGLLYHIHVSNRYLVINEPDKMTAEWVGRHELADFYDAIETWSRIAFDFYIRSRT
jgi:predicted NUDIX family phosphoesterase